MSTLREDAGSPSDPRNDGALLLLLRSNDRQAFSVLYYRYIRDVYLYAFAMSKVQLSAEEIAQDVWGVFWSKRTKLEVHGDSILPWLLVTTRNISLKYLRSSVRRFRHESNDLELYERVDTPSNSTSPEAKVEAEELRAAIAELVGSMSPTDQQIYELCLVEEMSYARAAVHAGISESAVRGRLYRIRKQLKVAFTNTEGSS